jgi:hypothetical protein
VAETGFLRVYGFLGFFGCLSEVEFNPVIVAMAEFGAVGAWGCSVTVEGTTFTLASCLELGAIAEEDEAAGSG